MTHIRAAEFDTSRRLLLRGVAGRLFRKFELVVTVVTIAVISGAVLVLTLHGGPNWPDNLPSTPLERAAYWLGYLFTLLEIALRPRAFLAAAKRAPFVVALVVIAFLSAAWSDFPSVSLTRAWQLGMWTLFGLFLSARYSTKELLKLISIALGVVAVLSLLFAVAAPGYGLELKGEWRGVFTTKNVLGEMMLLASVVFVLLAWHPGKGRRLAIAGALLTITLVVLARATGALLILSSLFVIIPTMVALRRGGTASGVAVCGILLLSTAAMIVYSEREPVLGALGKDLTLTGRTDLWVGVVDRIGDRPLLGYGYRAFWESTAGGSERIRAAVGWDVPHAHNGLLDLWLDLGLVGLLTFVVGYGVALRRAWLALRARVGLDGLWAMSFLIMLLLGNTTESSIYANFLIWSLFVAVSAIPASGDITPSLAPNAARARNPLRYRHQAAEVAERGGPVLMKGARSATRSRSTMHLPLGGAGDTEAST